MVCPRFFVFVFSFVIVLVFVHFACCNFYFYTVFVFQIAIVLVFVFTERSAIVLVFVTKIALGVIHSCVHFHDRWWRSMSTYTACEQRDQFLGSEKPRPLSRQMWSLSLGYNYIHIQIIIQHFIITICKYHPFSLRLSLISVTAAVSQMPVCTARSRIWSKVCGVSLYSANTYPRGLARLSVWIHIPSATASHPSYA